METRMIYLVRHGKIERSDERRYIGQIDLPLSVEGSGQAKIVQQIIGRSKINAAFCSDLVRSKETAQIIVAPHGIPVAARAELREISLGEWEGCRFDDIAKKFPNEFKARGQDIAYYQVPGGESFADCSKRVVGVFKDILATTKGNVLIVGHAGVNRLILSHILGMPLKNIFRIGQDYGCINIIQCTKSSQQVKLINYK